MNPWDQDGGYPSSSASVCESFQVDLSCLVDGELDERAAGRAMLHLETCDECRDFFDQTRHCLQLHLDMADPDRMLARISTLTGADLTLASPHESRAIEAVHRLSTILYQLGKAYVLAGTQAGWAVRVFEQAVPVEPTQTRGRGFVDGVLSGGESELGGVDWRHARGILNGRLKRIASPLEKGRKLLEEAIAVDGSHEEARLYLAYLHAHEGRTIQAFEEYRELFRTAVDENNRGHAAMQLGLLHGSQGNYRRALVCFRWVTVSGLSRRDPRFFVAHFDVGLYHALLGDDDRALARFRQLLDLYPDRLPEVSVFFANEESLREILENRPGFAERLVERCPELVSPAGEPEPGPPESGPKGGPDVGDAR